MKRYSGWIAFILAGVIPYLIFIGMENWYLKYEEKTTSYHTEDVSDLQMMQPTHVTDVMNLSVVAEDGSVLSMELETYVVGVVLAEMPASFEMEALKAQAVVARTYALKRNTNGGKHTAGAVCLNSDCCQAYCSMSEYEEAGGSKDNLNKVLTAVNETKDMVLTYQGELADATYFSCSGGKTEDAAAVWGQDIPYLISVESPGEEATEKFAETVSYDVTEFADKLDCTLAGDSADWFGNITYTEGNGVNTIEIGGTVYKGTQVRQLLGLNSTAFYMTAVGDRIIVTTKGFGHRVGMSQYGAEAMAVAGNDFKQILEHYYPGTSLQSFLE